MDAFSLLTVNENNMQFKIKKKLVKTRGPMSRQLSQFYDIS